MMTLGRFIILFGLCLFGAHISYAQTDEVPASAKEQAPKSSADYQALIQKAQEKKFNLTREEFELIRQAAELRVKELEQGLVSLGGEHYANTPDEGHNRMISAEVVRTKPLVKGEKNQVTIRLSYDDNKEPVTEERLQTFHTKKIHVMINEPQLNDYTHQHPQISDVPGEYVFSFTPETDCSYRIWADLLPKDGPEQTAQADVPGAKDCSDLKVAETIIDSATQDGFQYAMSMDTKELAKDQDTMVYFDVMDKDGKAFVGLEPVMGAYAHLVGFRGDFNGIAHVHPMGDTPFSSSDRGGPTLEFHLKPAESGYMRFFLQVLIDGEMRFIPFGVQVAEKGENSGRNIMQEMSADMARDEMPKQGNVNHEAMGH